MEILTVLLLAILVVLAGYLVFLLMQISSITKKLDKVNNRLISSTKAARDKKL